MLADIVEQCVMGVKTKSYENESLLGERGEGYR